MTNREKWSQALESKSGAEAFRIINDPKRGLNTAQRDVLWNLWKDVKYNKYTNPEWWASEVTQDRLLDVKKVNQNITSNGKRIDR